MPSSVIRSIRYDEAKQLLTVEFVSGAIYHYQQVPPSIYKAFEGSESKGIYFNDHVKDKFHFERVN
jgi:hypothetical protein